MISVEVGEDLLFDVFGYLENSDSIILNLNMQFFKPNKQHGKLCPSLFAYLNKLQTKVVH